MGKSATIIITLHQCCSEPQQGIINHNKSTTMITVRIGVHIAHHYRIFLCNRYCIKRSSTPVWPWGSTGSTSRQVCICHQTTVASAPLLPSSPLLSAPFPFLQSGETVSLRSIPLPQCFHPALITPICRHSKHNSVFTSAAALWAFKGSVRSAAWHPLPPLPSLSKSSTN